MAVNLFSFRVYLSTWSIVSNLIALEQQWLSLSWHVGNETIKPHRRSGSAQVQLFSRSRCPQCLLVCADRSAGSWLVWQLSPLSRHCHARVRMICNGAESCSEWPIFSECLSATNSCHTQICTIHHRITGVWWHNGHNPAPMCICSFHLQKFTYRCTCAVLWNLTTHGKRHQKCWEWSNERESQWHATSLTVKQAE